jgi:hypothetical protein
MTGFAVNISMLLFLTNTSPLTLSIASVCKVKLTS